MEKTGNYLIDMHNEGHAATEAGSAEVPGYATEAEMEEHCQKYACKDCPINNRCSMFDNLFKNSGGAAFTDCCE